MKPITIDEPINEILKRPEFAGHEEDVQPYPSPIAETVNPLSFRQVKQLRSSCWSHTTVLNGYNYLLETCRTQDCFHNVWTEEEIKEDSSRRKTRLISFSLPQKSRFALILPGGGYRYTAAYAEGFPVARILNQLMFAAFVLKYRCAEDAHVPNPQDDIAQALRYILKHADTFHIETDHYLVVGFSAGAHAASSFGTETLGYPSYGLAKPSGMILGYPVITMGKYGHADSRRNLLGIDDFSDSEFIDHWSIEKQITPSFPPTYVWQCEHDRSVPIENSRMLVDALKLNHVPVRYETFDAAFHGWGSAEETPAEGWLERAVRFLDQ